MRNRVATNIAWALACGTVILAILAIALLPATVSAPVAFVFGSRLGTAFIPVAVVAGAVVGVVIVSRHPRHPIGWFFTLASLNAGIWVLSDSYAVLALVQRAGALPGGVAAAWLANWVWVLHWGVAAPLFFLLFPDGRLPSRQWRLLVAAVGGVGSATIVALAVAGGPLASYPFQTNPLGVGGRMGDLVKSALPVLQVLLHLGIVAAAASLLGRFRRARGVQRQQLKWLTSACVLAGGIGLLAQVLTPWGRLPVLENIGLMGVTVVPLATGIAITRYRLYEIDRLISRTVTYTALTVLLAAAYVASVVLFGQVLTPLTEGSQVAVAASTLTVAAAFGPARRRVQTVVDRRFDRAHYDSQRAIEAYRLRLRDEVSLERVGAELLDVVHRTLPPSSASLWLRPRHVLPAGHGRIRATPPGSAQRVGLPDGGVTRAMRNL